MTVNRVLTISTVVVAAIVFGPGSKAWAQEVSVPDYAVALAAPSSVVGIQAAVQQSARPITDSAALAASQISQSGNTPSTRRRNDGLMWTGLAMWAGGAVMEVLSYTALKREDCWVSLTAFYCESGTNKPLFWSGAAVAGTGFVMWLIGNEKVSVAPSVTIMRGGVKASKSFSF